MENQEFNPPPVQTSSKPKLVYVLIVILVLGLGGIGGYLLGTKNTETKIPDKNIFPIVTLEPVAIPSPENWMTYTDSEYNYSIKYPGTWSVSGNNKNDPGFYSVVAFSKSTPNTLHGFTISVGKKVIDGSYPTSIVAPTGSMKLYQLNSIITDAKKAVYYTGVGDSDYVVNILIEKENNAYHIVASFLNPPSSSDIQEFDQIISTFKFL